MPLRGESIGTAYIRVLADGTGFPESVRHELDKADGNFEDAGAAQAKAYKKGLAEELAKNDKEFGRALDDHFTKALVQDDSLEHFFNSPNWKRQVTNWEAKWGGLGTTAAEEIESKFRKSGSLQGIENDMAGIVARINNIADGLVADDKRVQAAAEKAAIDFETRFRRSMDETNRVQREAARVSVDASHSVTNAWTDVRRVQLDLVRGWENLVGKFRTGKKEVKNAATIFGDLGHTVDNVAEKTGKFFGAGNRNNFFNFTGKFIQGAVGLLSVPLKLLDNVTQFGLGVGDALEQGLGPMKAISAGFTEMSKDANGVEQAGTGIVGSFTSIAIAAPILVAALVGVAAILGVVSALAFGVVAAVVALASTLAFGLVGVIAPLVGLLAPLALGLGAVAAGVLTITKNADTLAAFKKKIAPIIDGLKGIGNAFDSAFGDHFRVSLGRAADALSALDPLAHRIGSAFGNLATQFFNSFRSEEAQHFFDVMSKFVPEVITKLGIALGEFGAGLGGIFVDLVPTARHFLDFLDRITTKFHQWVTDHPGKILEFFERSERSVQAIGKFLGPVVSLVGELFNQGRGTGNNLFRDLGRQIQKFTDFLRPKSAAGNQHTVFDEAVSKMGHFQDNLDKLPKTSPLDNFFKNGHQVAADLGNVAVALGKIIGDLNSPNAQSNLHDILSTLTLISKLATPLRFLSEHPLSAFLAFSGIGTVAFALPVIAHAIDHIAHGVAQIGNIHLPNFDILSHIHIGSLGSVLDGVKTKLANFFHGLSGFGAGTLTIRPPSVDWIPGITARFGHMWSQISSGASGLAHQLAVKAGSFGQAAASWAIGMIKELVGLPGQIVGLFTGLGQKIINAIGSVVIHIGVDGPKSLVDKLTFGALATGGIINTPGLHLVGEAGAEAVVPLTGPLSAVDPSVRELSAIARGLNNTKSSGISNVTPMAGKTINVEQHITTVASDPRAAASEFLNHLTAVVA